MFMVYFQTKFFGKVNIYIYIYIYISVALEMLRCTGPFFRVKAWPAHNIIDSTEKV